MIEGWIGYFGGLLFLFGAYKFWKNPFNAFDDIDDWDDVTDENRSRFNQKRMLITVVSVFMSLGMFAFPKEITNKVYSILSLPTSIVKFKTISDYDCQDAANELKNREFSNAFGAVIKVIIVTESVEIERSDSKLTCQVTSTLSTNKEVVITAEFEEIEGEMYFRTSVNN